MVGLRGGGPPRALKRLLLDLYVLRFYLRYYWDTRMGTCRSGVAVT